MEKIVTAGRTTIVMINPSRFIEFARRAARGTIDRASSPPWRHRQLSADRECPSRAIADRVLAEAHPLGADLIVAGPLAMRVCGKRCSAASHKTY